METEEYKLKVVENETKSLKVNQFIKKNLR